MKKLFKIVGWLLLIIILVGAVAITYITQALPNIPLRTDVKVEVTPDRIARGEYLANNVCVCMDCHSTRDWSLYSGPPTPGTQGVGGEVFDQKFGFPGSFVSRNITPHGLKDWSDAEIYRTITCGIGRDNRAFFPVMPYEHFGRMSDDDIFSIIAYLRSIPAIASTPKASKAEFPMNIIMHMMHPQPVKLVNVTYGEYMVNAANCRVCHTKQDKGKEVGQPFAGGWGFPIPGDGTVTSANITPHETGIGGWSREKFIRTFKQYADSGYVVPKVDFAAKQMQTVMPWTKFAGMKEDDLGAIYDFLRTVKPVDNAIVKWTPVP
jgi:hypothetical protein